MNFPEPDPMRSASACNWLDAYPEDPCWGDVQQQDEGPDGSEVHACRGHAETMDWCNGLETARKYIPAHQTLYPSPS